MLRTILTMTSLNYTCFTPLSKTVREKIALS